ncbi:monocarboxylate transporter 12-B-like [Amblyomma americanum]
MAADHDHHRVQAAAAMVRRGGVDSARSWLVAVSCCWINFFSALMYKSSGVVYVGVLQTLEVTREEASWPLTLLAVFIFTTAPVAGVLALYVDIWKISLCGCLLSSFAVCLCFWANSVIYLTACLGVVQGFALGLLTLHNVIINQHFEKHRATASGISYAGPTFASIVYPPLVQVLFEEYGLRGSLLLFGGIMFHAVAGAFLQMEPNPRKTSYKVVPRDPPPEDTECSKLAGESFEKPKDGELTALNPLDCAADVQQTAAATNIETDILCTNRSADVPKLQRNVYIFLVPMFYLICASFVTVLFTMTTYLTVVVDFAVDHGVSRINAVLLISTYSLADLVARLGSGWISDRGFVSRGNMMALHFLIGGLALFAMPVFTTYAGQVTMAVVSGWATGCTMILVSVLLTEHIGLDRLPVSFGVTSFVAGALCLARPPLIGLYRDASGNYEGLFHLIGGVSLAVALLWFVATTTLWFRQRRK